MVFDSSPILQVHFKSALHPLEDPAEVPNSPAVSELLCLLNPRKSDHCGKVGPDRDRSEHCGIGCLAGIVGVKTLTPRIGEIKRMYVRPTSRNQGVGRALMPQMVQVSRQIGYMRAEQRQIY